jgi:hypothetical protein
VGKVLVSNPWASPFGSLLQDPLHLDGRLLTLPDVPDMAGPPLDLVGVRFYIIYYFWSRALLGNCRGATWCPLIGPCGILGLVHLVADVTSMSTSYRTRGTFWVVPHGITWGAMWNFSIGPIGAPKSLLVGDMWQPLVLPCGMMT